MGEAADEPASGIRLTLNFQFCRVVAQHMLDDREAKAGPAPFARSPRVDPVEAFGDARNVFGRDSFPVVPYFEDRFLSLVAPHQGDVAVCRRVVNRVYHEVDDGAAQLLGIPRNRRRDAISHRISGESARSARHSSATPCSIAATSTSSSTSVV